MLTIRLLGPPALAQDDTPLPSPRGRKAWGLLGYLLLAERPPARRQLAELLFGDADDPLGALRWSLTELRRALQRPGALRGDPVLAGLGADIAVDVQQLTRPGADGRPVLDPGGELLEGIELRASPQFDSWLSVERHRVSALIEAQMREAATTLLATRHAAEAIPYASRAVARNPLQEGNHELLVRSLAMAGDHRSARRQVAIAEDILRRELGVNASSALHDAASSVPGSTMVPPRGGRAGAVSQLEAGRAAIAAGAVDAGLQCLRQAVAEAIRGADVSVQGRALAALGGALVHAARGRDEEGAVVLREAVELAGQVGDRGTAVTALRELGFIEVQAGRRVTAEGWLAQAQALAETDQELAAVHGVRGMNASDRGDYPSAFAHLDESIEQARRGRDPRQLAWSLSILARAHLLRAERSQAAVALGQCLTLVEEQRWLAFLPWPQSLQAELNLAVGDLDAAAAGLERAWALACQLNDPCWEGMAARGLGLVEAARGDHGTAMSWLAEAATRSNRVTDRYQWVHAFVLDTMIGSAGPNADPGPTGRLVDRLAALAARCDMRELVVRAHLHRWRLGDPTALAAARLLGRDLDNPALSELLGAEPAPGSGRPRLTAGVSHGLDAG